MLNLRIWNVQSIVPGASKKIKLEMWSLKELMVLICLTQPQVAFRYGRASRATWWRLDTEASLLYKEPPIANTEFSLSSSVPRCHLPDSFSGPITPLDP